MMCTYWENAVKDFLQSKSVNIERKIANKSNKILFKTKGRIKMTNIEKAKEMWKKGAIEINAVDKNGESLKQYDSVIAHDGFEWRMDALRIAL